MFKLLASLLIGLTFVSCTTPESALPVRAYTLDTCVVMDSKLGSMGDPIVRIYEGRELKFCCMPCVKEFESDPEFYLARLPQN